MSTSDFSERLARQEIDRLRAENEKFKSESVMLTLELSRVVRTIKYLVGIAEHGTCTTLPDTVTAKTFVLDYVKHLESENKGLRAELLAAERRGMIRAAEIVLSRLETSLPTLATLNGNKALKYAANAIQKEANKLGGSDE